MKKTIIFLFSLNLTSFSLFAQKLINARIVDKETGKGVEFAAVCIKGKDKGTYTDFYGNFQLDDVRATDTLVVKHIAFARRFIPVVQVLSDSLLTIEPETYTLQGLIVKPKKNKEFNIGLSKYRSKYSMVSPRGGEIATLIIDEKFKDCLIKEITIHIKEKGKQPLYLKTHIYQNDNGIPGNEIKYSNIHKVDQVKSIIRINISNSNITFPSEGLFIGVEWIGETDDGMIFENTNLSLKTINKNLDNITLYRIWDYPWKEISTYLKDAPGYNGEKVNACIGLTLVK